MNELRCYGVRLYFDTKKKNLDDAVRELERHLYACGIGAELSGMMRLYDEADRLIEEC